MKFKEKAIKIIYIILSSPIWLPISLYQFGVVFSDNLRNFLIKKA